MLTEDQHLKLEHLPEPPSNMSAINETIFDIASRIPSQRTPQEQIFLTEFLDHIQTIKQTFSKSIDYKQSLLACCHHLETCIFPAGTPILLNGDKCNEVLVILKGQVNVYDMKSSQELQRQKDEMKGAMSNLQSSKNKTSSLLGSGVFARSPTQKSIVDKKKPGKELALDTSKSGGNPTSLEEISDIISSEVLIVDNGNNVENKNMGTVSPSRRKLKKTKTLANFLKKQPDCVSYLDEKQEEFFEHLPMEEQLLMESEECRKKYFRDGVCLVVVRKRLGMNEIINERSLLTEYRSPVAYVAQEDAYCLKLSSDVFREIMKEELAGIEIKKNFFMEFFRYKKQAAILQVLEFVGVRRFRMHEKIFSEGDNSKGVYFTRSGEVKLLVNRFVKNIETQEKMDALSAIPTKLFLPHQQRNLKRYQAAVGVVLKGDFFGEDLILEEQRRRYTAVSGSNDLVLFYVSHKHFQVVREVYPEFFKILKERALQRRNWVDGKLKKADLIKEKEIESARLNKKQAVKIPGLTSPEPESSVQHQEEKHFISQAFLLRNEDIQQIEEKNMPNSFLVFNEKSTAFPSHLDATIKIKDEKEDLKNLLSSRRSPKDTEKTEPRHPRNNMIPKPVENSPTARLFTQEKSERHHQKKIPKLLAIFGKNEKSMTGLNKDKAYLHGLQSLVQNQRHLLVNQTSARMTSFTSESPLMFEGPQLGVKSYRQYTEPEDRPDSVITQKYYLKVDSPVHYHPKRNFDLKQFKSQQANNSLATSPVLKSFRSESIINSSSPIWNLGRRTERVQSEAVLFKTGNGENCVNIHMKSMREQKVMQHHHSEFKKSLSPVPPSRNFQIKSPRIETEPVMDLIRKKSVIKSPTKSTTVKRNLRVSTKFTH